MDKEARAWIMALIRDHPKATLDDLNVLVSLISEALKELGYRKLPKDKPPLLSDEKIEELCKADYVINKGDGNALLKAIAQAQWELDVKHYEGI